MTFSDFLWVFSCGGYFGWLVHRIATRAESLPTAGNVREGHEL